MNQSKHAATLPRLRRIEGQVRGLIKMVDDDRYCVDILTQIEAARAALKKVADRVLHDHVETCVAGAIESGDAAAQRQKVDELMDVFGRFAK